MNVLSIGNSFSADAQKWLHCLAKDNDVNIETANLFIGGCSLKTHWQNFEANEVAYAFEINGNNAENSISIIDALRLKNWDVVTIQQASNYSGMYETYEPYISSLIAEIKKEQPNAKIYFHETWAYETDSTHSGFANYDNDQEKMFKSILNACEIVKNNFGIKVIPSGEVIQSIRENIAEFDYKNGGLSLCRDGFHMSLDYGRFAVAATWFCTLTGKKLLLKPFNDFDVALTSKIIELVNNKLVII